MNFTTYTALNTVSAIEYLNKKTTFFDAGSILTCEEIGDGNLNFVYRIMDKTTRRSVIIKQAGAYARATPDYKLTTDRSRIEAEILNYQNRLAKGFVPEVYLYDEVMCCCIMEDLRDYKILRNELIDFHIYHQFARQIAQFLADTLIRTSDLCMDSAEKKEHVKRFMNPELCKISEDLVFTDPYTNAGGTNDVFPPNLQYVQEKVYHNMPLRLEAAKLSLRFKNCAESLIHGDLHSGSIFVKENSTKVFDPEFAFYGPAGYDVGNVIGNLLFAWTAAKITQAEGADRNDFLAWMEQAIVDIVDIFACRCVEIIMSEAVDPLYRSEEFANWYTNGILCDSSGYAGMEMIRRVVGEAHVKDITILPDPLRIQAEQLLIQTGERLIMQRESMRCGKDFIQILPTEE